MTMHSRRSIIAAGAAGAALATIPFPIWFERYAMAATPLVRYNATSAQGQIMLGKYAQAVSIMKARAKGNPCGWTFQWYTHAVRGDRTKAGEIATLSSLQQPLANAMWNTCQAHSSTVGAVEDYFLPWHRMFVYFFERIVRNAIGDPSFTLPYWNYVPVTNSVLPATFRNSASSLYRASRNGPANGGSQIATGTYFNNNALAQSAYSPVGVVPGFCLKLDNELHGRVHVQTGNTVGMGSIPWAANDPIFWAHHCNIDRLWASWNAGGRANPSSSSWLNKTFVFADEHCNQVSATIKDFAQIAPLGYAYDKLEPVPAMTVVQSHLVGTFELFAKAREPAVPLGPGPVSVELAAPANVSPERASPARRLAALAAGRRIYLVIRNLRANAQPGVGYDIYVNLPERATGTAAASSYAGSITFFDVIGDHGDHGGGLDKFFSFDVTDVFGTLSRAGRLGDRVSVTIVPKGEPAADAKPVIGEISFAEQ